MSGLDKLDDEDYPSVSMGQAAELLDVQPAFLRSLDTAGVLHPHRTSGGHRRYSRRQLAQAVRLRALLDDGHSLGSAQAILDLENRVAASDNARRRADDARDEARTDLRERTDQLRETQRELDEARDEISALNAQLSRRA
ncbi:helix-turn-helix domain-containing protein [Pseudonocardia sp.]|jgi:DNA-binding transcriptional MerR regulator|uniref:helix-turn-helix domain-containing protein n=1 Tax=Pseudonocardia sp. TaxID=60912 RepID=UPI003D0A7AE9